MTKKSLYLYLLFTVFLSSCNQKAPSSFLDSKNDSIKKYLDLASNDTLPYVNRIKYNDKAYSFIDLSKNDTLTISLLYKTTMFFYRFNQMKELKFTSNLLHKKAILSKEKYWIGMSYKVFGLFYMNNSENEKGLYYFFKAKKIMVSLNKNKEITNILFNISLTQYYAGDFLGSNRTVFQILKINHTLKTNLNSGKLYNLIASNLSNLKQVDKAIQYYQKIDNKKGRLNFKNTIAINISLSYIELGEYQKAFNELNSNIKIKELRIIHPNNYATSLSILGYCKLKMNKLYDLPNIFFRVDEIYKKNKSTYGRNYNQIYLSIYYEKTKDTINAIKAAKKALLLSKSYKNPSDILKSLEQLIKVDKLNASKNAQEYIRVNDSLQIAERRFRDKFARIAFETDEISQEKDKAINQKWIVIGVSAVVILIVILILIITRQRLKQKEFRLLQKQQKADEEIYHLMLTQKIKEDEVRQSEKKRIALELHDGIMNKLSSARLNLAVLSHKTDEATIQKCLTYVNDIYQIEKDIRSISHDLNKEVFKKENSFIKMAKDFISVQNQTSKTNYKLELDQEIDWNSISSELKMHLYRIIQEASHNINKYAHAKSAIINIVLDYPNICMSVTDDGIGFDTSVKPKGIGIQNMKTRVKLLNGKITINSLNQKSTSINIAIPINDFK